GLQERLKLARVEKITPGQGKLLASIYQHVGLKPDTNVGALGGTPEEPTIRTFHGLTDGADSTGVVEAGTRVYVNEGSGWDKWVNTMAVNPFDLKQSRARNFPSTDSDLI